MFKFINMAIFIVELSWKVSRVSVEACAIPSSRHSPISLLMKRKEASKLETFLVSY
jgi:hypothetical protein